MKRVRRLKYSRFLLVFVFFLTAQSNASETPPRAETGELIPVALVKSDGGGYVKGRVICHTFDQLLNLPAGDAPVFLEDLNGDTRFIELLHDVGVWQVRRVFNYKSVEAVNERIQAGDEDFIRLDLSYVFELYPSIEIEEVLRVLQERPEIVVVEPDYQIPFSFSGPIFEDAKDDPRWDGQWNLHDPDEDEEWGIGCPAAWGAIGYGSSNIRVGVIDKTIRGSHLDFSNNNVSYVEGLAQVPLPFGGYFWSTDPFYWDIDSGHGNKVAGVLGARSFNGIGVHGVAGGNGVDEEGVTVVALCLTGLEDVVPSSELGDMIIKGSDPESAGGAGCDVINLSASNPEYSHNNRLAVIHAYERGCSFNSGKGENMVGVEYGFRFPADYDYSMVTSVSGYNKEGRQCLGDCGIYYTNGGKGLDFLAPADTFPALGFSNLYGSFSGVSGANPHVAGSNALLRSSSICQAANLRPEDYEWLLKLTTCLPTNNPNNPCGDNRFWDEDYGHGLLRVGYAAQHISEPGHVFRSYTGFGGTVCDSLFASPSEYGEYSFVSKTLKGNYKAQVLKVRVPIQYSDDFEGTPLVWGLCDQVIGVSAANPNFCKPYCVVENGSQGTDGCHLFTYVMRLYDINTGVFVRWFPCLPENAVAKCRVSGVLASKAQNQSGDLQVINNYPGEIGIRFNATVQANAKMSVYDVRGRLVANAVSLFVQVGDNKAIWDRRDTRGRSVSAGVYFIMVVSKEQAWTQKVMVVH